MTRSPFFYVGDKYKLMNQLLDYFPSNINRLIEPFSGGGSVFINTKANEYLENDNNTYMIRLHKFLFSFKDKRKSFFNRFEKTIMKYGLSASYLGVNVPDELKEKHVKTYYAVYNKQAYNDIKRDFNANKKNMMLLYILLIYGFNHMLRFNSSGDFNLPVGNVDYNKNVVKALNDYFDFVDSHNVIFSNLDFEKFIKKIKFKEGDFLYLDPPYLISSSEYNKYWTENEEKRLLKLLDQLNEQGIKFALSNVLEHKGRKNDLLDEWAKKYNKIKITSNYISFNDNTVKETTKEVLITNYGNSTI